MRPVFGVVALLAIACARDGGARGPFVPSGNSGPDPSAPAPTAVPMTPQAQTVLTWARGQVGKPYCWGGNGPTCYDCSGFAKVAWSLAGVTLPRTTAAMGAQLTDVPVDSAQPGDLLWWPGHVAIYAGNGREVEALNAKDGVVERDAVRPPRVLRPK